MRIQTALSVPVVLLLCGLTHAGEIHDAVRAGNATKVAQLLRANPELVKTQDADGTPLHSAAEGLRLDIVRLLLASGADVNARDKEGSTPLHRVIIGGGVILSLSTPFSGTVSGPKVDAKVTVRDVVALLVDKGANVNAEDDGGETPLMWASARRYKDVVELLLTAGAKVGHADKTGATALHCSALGEQDDVATILLRKGADTSAATKDGITPLHQAVACRNDAVIKLLLKSGAKCDVKDSKGHTPLQWAAALGAVESARILLASGADPNLADSTGRTALHWAACQGHKKVAEQLVDRRADLAAKDAEGKTPVELATDTLRFIRYSDPDRSREQSFVGIGTKVGGSPGEKGLKDTADFLKSRAIAPK